MDALITNHMERKSGTKKNATTIPNNTECDSASAVIANFRRIRTGPRIAHPMAVTISVNNTSDMISYPFYVFFVQSNHTYQIS